MSLKTSFLATILRYIFYDLKYKVLKSRREQFAIVDTIQTIHYILQNKCSISRYGDGEFNIIFGNGNGFQGYDKILADRLQEILKSNYTSHIVCIPYAIRSTHHLNIRAKYALQPYVSSHLKKLETILDKNKRYYDACITRFYIDYKNKRISKKILLLLMEIWKHRAVCIIEGTYSRLGVGNNLFDNAESITRILCPSENAFTKYDAILEEAQKIPQNTLILIALGMTATVLAFDLAQKGYQALDIGHIDVEYEWLLQGAKKKIALSNKYVNEVVNGKVCADVHDPDYIHQIRAVIQ